MRAKLHHFIPITLQRHFCQEDGRIWYSEKNASGWYCRPELRNPKSTFKRRDFYTVLSDEDIPSDEIETGFYGPLDDQLGRALPEILAQLRADKCPVFSADSEPAFVKAVFQMMKRTPHTASDFDEEAVGREVIEGALDDALAENIADEYLNLLRTDLGSATKHRQIGRDVRVRALLAPMEKVDALMQEFSVHWVRAPERHSYVLASRCVYIIGNGGPNGIGNQRSEIWMPIAPDVCVVLMRRDGLHTPRVFEDTRDHVRNFNRFAIRKSEAAASHSPKLLNSLLGHK